MVEKYEHLDHSKRWLVDKSVFSLDTYNSFVSIVDDQNTLVVLRMYTTNGAINYFKNTVLVKADVQLRCMLLRRSLSCLSSLLNE